MLEMTETAHILQHATPRSLIILDEVGRGTGTADGLAIAQAVIEYLVQRVGAKTLFTTHYHEVTTLANRYAALRNACLEVRKVGDEVTFLYKVSLGVSNHSYGIHVAKLAGLPEEVVTRAAALLVEHAREPAPNSRSDATPLPGWNASPDTLVAERLRGIDPLHTTPFEALQLLHEIRELVVQHQTVQRPIPSPSPLPRRGEG